tara:strand:+ start:584 stop:1753 length:1170 start_codon:yes stop_codon:yes gene_type:complete
MDDNSLTIGQKIKRFRLINDIRQEEMAEKMGVSRATLINYEKGHTTINMDVLTRLGEAYPNFKINKNNKEKAKIIDNGIINFNIFFKVLLDRKLFIIISSLSMLFIGYALSFLLINYYTAEISLYPAKKDNLQGLGQFQSIASNLGINSADNEQDFNIPDVVKSNLIAKKIIDIEWESSNGIKLNLIKLWKIDKKPLIGSSNQEKTDINYFIDVARKKLDDHISVNEDRLTGLIRINTTFRDPLLSSDIANFIGQQVQNYIQKENSAQSTKEKIFISERLGIVKKELEYAEIKLKEFKERNKGYEDSPELFMIFSQLFRESEAKKQVYLMLQQQLELARIEEVKQSPILHILDTASPPTTKSSPNRILICLAFSLSGFLLSSIKSIFEY